MAQIRSLTAEQFVDAVRVRDPNAEDFFEELEFFSALDGWYLGVLFRHRHSGHLGFVVFGPDENGTYRGIDVGHRLPSEDRARDGLLAGLERAAAGGQQVHPQ